MSQIKYDIDQIKQLLLPSTQSMFTQFEHLNTVSSTNDYLLHRSQQREANCLCVADKQSHCRGRRGQIWSNNEEDICFSFLWNTDLSLEKLPGLSLVVALSVVKALSELGLEPGIAVKWPNDIFYNKKKLAGILIESTKVQGKTAVIVGVGINVTDDKQKTQLPNPYICLSDITSHRIDNNKIIASILNEVEQDMLEYQKNGLHNFTKLWQQYDFCHNQEITVNTNQTQVTGINAGINLQGELLLNTDNQTTLTIHSGKIAYLKNAVV